MTEAERKAQNFRVMRLAKEFAVTNGGTEGPHILKKIAIGAASVVIGKAAAKRTWREMHSAGEG
jgi:hypothetical protein